MGRYIIRRLLLAGLVVISVVTAVFFLLRLAGDPIALLVPLDAPQEQIERVRKAYGFDEHILVQYVRFLLQILAGDLGTSIRYNRPSMELALERLPASVELALVTMIVAIALSWPIGVFAALKRGSVFDNICMLAAMLGQSIPTFWLGVVCVIVFSVQLRVLPTSGRGGLQHLVLPCGTLAIYSMARLARVARSSMLDVLGEDYVRTARAKGLRESVVVYRHALRNATISVVTMISYMLGSLIGGSIVTEIVFAWPGIGRLMVEAVYNRDYPVVQAAVLLLALCVVAINLVTDITYAFLNPRIRYT